MHILKSIGNGTECVYVYYYPNDRLLAEAIGRDTWECKIGMTSTGDTLARVLAQTGKTSRHQEPVVALEIYTNNAYRLESDIHKAFYASRLPSSKISGDEWFMTNPEKVENYFISNKNLPITTVDIGNSYVIDDLQSLALAIKQVRKQRKLTQSDLGLPRSTVAKIEGNNGGINVDTLLKVLEKLDCKLIITQANNLV